MSTNWVGFGQSQVSSTFMDFCEEERCFWFVFYLDANYLHVTNPGCVFHNYFLQQVIDTQVKQIMTWLFNNSWLNNTYQILGHWTIPSHKSLVIQQSARGCYLDDGWMVFLHAWNIVGPGSMILRPKARPPVAHGTWGHDPCPVAASCRWNQQFVDA